jgi:hypothetical protein
MRVGYKGAFPIHYINAPTAAEARGIGAMMNIADGKGTVFDAAKVFRDTGMKPENLVTQFNLLLSNNIVRQGVTLAALHDSLFYKVAVTREIPVERAVIIGSRLENHADQLILIKALELREKNRKNPVNNAVLNELIDQILGSVRVKVTGPGNQPVLIDTGDIEKNLLFEKAEISANIIKRATDDKRLFELVGSKSGELEGAGNVLAGDENAQRAASAALFLYLYNKLKLYGGAIDAALNHYANELNNGVKRTKVYADAYKAISDIVFAEAKAEQNKPKSPPDDPRVEESLSRWRVQALNGDEKATRDYLIADIKRDLGLKLSETEKLILQQVKPSKKKKTRGNSSEK